MKKYNSFFKKIALFATFSTLFSLKIVASTVGPTDPIQGDTIIGQQQEFVKNFNKSFTVGKNEVVMLAINTVGLMSKRGQRIKSPSTCGYVSTRLRKKKRKKCSTASILHFQTAQSL